MYVGPLGSPAILLLSVVGRQAVHNMKDKVTREVITELVAVLTLMQVEVVGEVMVGRLTRWSRRWPSPST